MVRWWPRAIVLAALCAFRAEANDMVADMRTLQMNDLVTITISVEGAFAANDFVEVPLQNLDFVGEPSVSSEFSWINGEITRRKLFRYRLRPLGPGPAQVGPVELKAEEGQTERLAAIALQVLADRASASNDAQVVLRELLATDREPFFVVAEIDKRTAFVGEAVTITWFLYNAASMQQWQIVSIPKLSDFWSEELTRSETPERLYVDNLMVQRMPIRRVVLFPLRSGRLRVDGMTAEAAIMRRTQRGPFSLFEGELVEATYTSAPIELDVKAIPPGPEADAVGQLSLTCESPLQRGSGPVVLRVALAGLGNVRAAVSPRFEGQVDGALQIEGGEVTVSRDEGPARMTRRWRYLILPAAAGMLQVPALTMNVFDPAAAVHRQLRCSSATLDVVANAPQPAPAVVAGPGPRRIPWRGLAGGMAFVLALLILVPRGVGELRLRRDARAIVRGASPAEIRARMVQRLQVDIREQSDRGDAWRALCSILDAAERDRDLGVDAGDEILQRVREMLRIARR